MREPVISQNSIIVQLIQVSYSIVYIQIKMIGPHYQRLAQAQRQITGKQMLQRVQAHTGNPLTAVIDKLKRQFSQYETAYSEDITAHQISSVDRLLSFDGKLGPILAQIQKENNLLRRELSLFQSQLSNSVGICQQLIAENNQLKQALIQKNADLHKIIQTVARNQSETRNQLEDKMALLQQENNILIQHLEQIKRKHQEYRKNFEGKDEEVGRWERKWSQGKKHLTQAIERQREVTRRLAVSEHLLFEQKQKYQILENKFHNAELEKSDMQRQIAMMQGDRQNFDPEALRRSIQNQYLHIMQEHKLMKAERQNLLRESQKSKGEKQKFENTLNDMQKKFNKVLNEYELTTNLLNEQKGKNQTLITTLKKMQIKIDEIKNENVQLKMEVESGKSMIFAKERSLYSEIQDLRRQLDDKSSHSAKLLREIQVKHQQLLDSKQIEIKRLVDENTEYRRLADRR